MLIEVFGVGNKEKIENTYKQLLIIMLKSSLQSIRKRQLLRIDTQKSGQFFTIINIFMQISIFLLLKFL